MIIQLKILINHHFPAPSKYLLKAELDEVSPAQCKKEYSPSLQDYNKIENGIIQSQICTKSPNGTNQDACQGLL